MRRLARVSSRNRGRPFFNITLRSQCLCNRLYTPNDNAKARELFEKAIALDPGDGLTRASLAFFLLRGRKFDEAAAEFEEALKTNPNDARILVLATEFDTYTARPEEAIRRIKEAMRLNPNYPNWYL